MWVYTIAKESICITAWLCRCWQKFKWRCFYNLDQSGVGLPLRLHHQWLYLCTLLISTQWYRRNVHQSWSPLIIINQIWSAGTAEAFFSWSGQESGAQSAPQNFHHFNYIHDHDVINIVPLWCAHLPIARLAPAFDSAQAPACAKSSNVATPLTFNRGLALWIHYPAKKWSGQNRTSRTGSAAPAMNRQTGRHESHAPTRLVS